MRISGKKLLEYFTEINTRHICVDERECDENEVSIPKVVSRLTIGYSMLTVTSYSSECCVPSGLDFEAARDSVVRYLQKQLKERPPPLWQT